MAKNIDYLKYYMKQQDHKGVRHIAVCKKRLL